MKITILTLFEDMLQPLYHSILGKAIQSGQIELDVVDIRQYSNNRHRRVDDTVYGGGPGMLMTVQPIYDTIMAVDGLHAARRLYLSPAGRRFDDTMARELAKERHILLLCGHYEGVDQRVIDLCIDESISIGDYILTGGELAAMVVVDAVSRFCDGVLGDIASAYDESFCAGMLEYPQYTRPQEWMGMSVPHVLLSGNHAEIDKWKKEQSMNRTMSLRPDLLKDKERR